MFERYDKNELVKVLLEVIDNSHNYIKASFTNDYVELVYWIKEPYKTTKTQIFLYDDYGMATLKRRQATKMRDYIYEHMALKNYHAMVNDPQWHNQTQGKAVPCIYPKQ